MSTLYNLEPQPTAKVLLTTTSGDILLELFAKQTPLASRSFLQHCLDGYYNNTTFHRLVPGFILQGGDPTGTGEGGDSIFSGGMFEDEFHSRLKWNRRGLLGMANEGRKGTNGSQFFLTLGECRELEGRNTLFGRVVGDTIFNVVKMGEAELGDGERPLYPTRITGAEVLVNPFDDMVKREVRRLKEVKEEKKEGKKGKKKGGKVLLSFGGEEADGGAEEPVAKKEKFNTKLINAETKEGVKEHSTTKSNRTNGVSKAAEKPERTVRRRSSSSKSPPPRRPDSQAQLPLPNEEVPSRSPSVSSEPAQVGKMTSLLEKTNAQIADLKASMKRNVQTAPAADLKQKSMLEQMIPATAVRGRKRKRGAAENAKEEKQTLDLLNAFMSKLKSAPPEDEASRSPDEHPGAELSTDGIHEDPAVGNDDEAELCDLHFIASCQSCRSWDQHMSGDADAKDDDENGWMSHALSFEQDRLGKDLTWKKKNEEELVVIDPREKAKDIKDEQRARKLARTGGSTAWAIDRDRGRAPERRAGEKS